MTETTSTRLFRLVRRAVLATMSALATIPLYLPATASAAPTQTQQFEECMKQLNNNGLFSHDAQVAICCKQVGGTLATAGWCLTDVEPGAIDTGKGKQPQQTFDPSLAPPGRN